MSLRHAHPAFRTLSRRTAAFKGSEPCETVRATTEALAGRLNAPSNPHPREAPLRGALRSGAEEPPAWKRLPTARGIAGPLGCAPRTWSRALVGSAPLGSGGFARTGVRREVACAAVGGVAGIVRLFHMS